MSAPKAPAEQIDKAAARRSFERAASSYEAAAVLQREISQRLLERLDYVRLQPNTVLDLGCGTGLALDDLCRRYRGAQVLALDFALGMLAQARRRGYWRNRPRALCADMDRLPLAADSVDLIVSNATLQWSNDLSGCFAELHRVLRPNGLLLFTTFGPDTLIELRHAWAEADAEAHVAEFLDMHDIGDALVHARFADPVMDCERLTLTYTQVSDLMADMKALGTQNRLQRRPRGLTGRERLRRMTAAYEHLRQDGRLPSTWEVIYGLAWMPAQKSPAASITSIPVSAIGRAPKSR
ncbi:malonyl-ACP O-methyltransferase BioC [Rhabdochromatium marinum]|uniref:malonyl-ACP O-methyltransferase BioC n=1 Tax=Rhabdochromatium marinum TaxID=48729 RepID=UPI0019074E49|nr:malonyl-ACP O-methyltransferase BioC [Rhabdochromatium marinum]MBK1649493.1 malonyl-[acyl-carrier protein] O-methyltransferase BioC [Rhabdochromatium marinum]